MVPPCRMKRSQWGRSRSGTERWSCLAFRPCCRAARLLSPCQNPVFAKSRREDDILCCYHFSLRFISLYLYMWDRDVYNRRQGKCLYYQKHQYINNHCIASLLIIRFTNENLSNRRAFKTKWVIRQMKVNNYQIIVTKLAAWSEQLSIMVPWFDVMSLK